MSGTLLIACMPGQVWAAFLDEEDELVGLRLLRAGTGVGIGEVYLGRVVALKPELPAALVDIGLGRPGFLSAEDALPRGDISHLHQGEAVLVQVAKEARADKAAGLTMRPRLPGRLLELTPKDPGIRAGKGIAAAERERVALSLAGLLPATEGVVLRAAAAGAAPPALAEELASLRARWAAIERAAATARPPQPLEEGMPLVARALALFAPAAPSQIVIDDRAGFAEARRWLAQYRGNLLERLVLHREATPLLDHYGVAGDIAELLEPRVALPGGGALTFEATSAATLVDVDSGSAGAGTRPAGRAILATNLAAARALARQIRLRGLAGPIVVDFIGMRERGERERVRAALAEALAGDPDSEILGWTRLGHLELVRKRRQAGLAELVYERLPGGGLIKQPATVALEALAALARAAAATPPRAPMLALHPAVAALLDGPLRQARQDLEARLGQAIRVETDPGRARDSFDFHLG